MKLKLNSKLKMEEILDEVNDQDEVIGQLSRSEIHRLKKRHRATHIFVFNDLGKLFLQRRSEQKDCFPNKWDSSASGHLERGESYDECAKRELSEEIGLIEKKPEALFKLDACEETGWEFVWVYRVFSNGPFRLQSSEIAEADWFSMSEIHRWISQKPSDFTSGFILILQHYHKDQKPHKDHKVQNDHELHKGQNDLFDQKDS